MPPAGEPSPGPLKPLPLPEGGNQGMVEGFGFVDDEHEAGTGITYDDVLDNDLLSATDAVELLQGYIEEGVPLE